MRAIGTSTLLILIVILGADRVNACSCNRRVAPCKAYAEAKAVFIARVTAIDTTGGGAEKMTFASLFIEEAFKGISETRIKMWQGTGTGDCSFVFEKGTAYLIYAGYSDESGRFHTNICTRTAPLKYAGEDLNYIRGLPGSNQSNSLSGTVVKYDYEEPGRSSDPELISGVKVIAEGEDNRRLEAITNTEGFYKIVGLPAGRYRLRAEIPSYLSLAYKSPETVDVPSEGCASADFLTRTDGRISGVLLDNRGRVTPDTDVDLIPFELAHRLGDRSIGRYKKTDAAGRFEFTELKPGRYLIGVNIRQEPEGDNPFRRTFYPGVSSVSKARVIVLGRGERLDGNDIRLPASLPVQVIHGVFLWPDGKPVNKGLLRLKDEAGQDLDFAEPDNHGRFTLKAIRGTKGWVHGSVMVRVESGLDVIEANPIRLIANSKVGPIKLVASRKARGGVRILP